MNQTITHSLTQYYNRYIARSSVPNSIFKAVTSPFLPPSLQVVLVDLCEDDQLLNLVADEADGPIGPILWLDGR